MHYNRWREHGDPLAGRTVRGELLRYFSDVVLTYEGDECLIWPFNRNPGGYGRVSIDGREQLVSRRVCEEANGPPPTPEHHAAHSCGKGHEGCCTKRHLSWKTGTENMADKLLHGTDTRGERNGASKLNAVAVREIIALKGTLVQKDIAQRYGIRVQQVSKIQRGERWGWLE